MRYEFLHYGCSPRLSRRSRRPGMTLVELMVSVAVLTLLMVAFGMILSTIQKVVTRSNALMQFNSAAAAITQVIRQDVSEISKEGFLSIWQEASGRDHLVFTTVGPYTSDSNSHVHANAARIDYGKTPTNDPNDAYILWRRVTLLAYGSNPGTNDDFENQYLGAYTGWTSTNIDSNVAVGTPPVPGLFTIKPPGMVAVPKTPADIENLRCVLATGCTSLTVSYLDSSNNWQPATTAPASWVSTSTWPTAIKINFTLSTRPDLPKNNPDRMDMDYEVICPIRQ